MQITPLELGLATLAVVVVFGPKRLPKKERTNHAAAPIDLRTLSPSQHAAGRAPSPLQQPQPQNAAEHRRFVMDGVAVGATRHDENDPWISAR